jgi:hypothetical protein
VTLAKPKAARIVGVSAPRVAPPSPASAGGKEFDKLAKGMDIDLMPWQNVAGRYLAANTRDGWRFREVCIVVARQNGKTEMLLPRIRMGLERGERILHTAQNRTLPRAVFMRVAATIPYKDLAAPVRFANGQERITMRNGGSYTIIAPQRGARGLSADTLIFDEVREFEDFDVIAAATPTLTASHNPQVIYLSNAGSDASVVLNDLKRRGEEGGSDDLAYVEWSAGLERAADDREGWAEANPAIGHLGSMMRTLEVAYNTLPGPVFETEHLCRWVASMQPKLVSDAAWQRCRATIEEKPHRAAIAVNMDPSGKRASAVMSWQMTDGRVALVELIEATGDPIDLPALGRDLKALAAEHRVKRIAFASWTDKALAAYLPRAEAVDGKDFANASENFARLVLSQRLAWDGAAHITDDLTWTARKPHDSGAWQAVPAAPERSVTSVLAAIRATWWASAPPPSLPRIG